VAATCIDWERATSELMENYVKVNGYYFAMAERNFCKVLVTGNVPARRRLTIPVADQASDLPVREDTMTLQACGEAKYEVYIGKRKGGSIRTS